MSRQTMVRAVLATVGLMGASVAGATGTPDPNSIDTAALQAAGCFGKSACVVNGASLSATGGVLAKKSGNGATGFGVSGGAAGAEIDIDEILHVDFGQPRSVVAIKVLFLYNGPEFGDKAEKASVTADGTTYTLSVRNNADDAQADWTGPGTVTKCGSHEGERHRLLHHHRPISRRREPARVPGDSGRHTLSGYGGGTNDSDYALGFIDVAALKIVDLEDCAGERAVRSRRSTARWASASIRFRPPNPGGTTETLVIPVQLPDCRYVPNACLALLPPAGDSDGSDDEARAILIDLGVIKTLDPYGADKLKPAAQLLNVTPLLPVEVTSLFDSSGTPPDGLPPLYVGPRWRGQSGNDFRIDGYFFKTETGVVFSDVFGGLIDVSVLTGDELGCEVIPGNLLAWDVITTVSELAKGVGGRYGDTPVNVGCQNPTKVAGSRLSLYSINLEVAPDTYGPTVKSYKAKVTVDNDAVFARLVQSLWKDIGEVRSQYACKQADPAPAGGVAPLSSAACKKLASLWSIADFKVNLCVNSAFLLRLSSYQTWICGLAAKYVSDFKAAIPATASGSDPYNRRGELDFRTVVFQHIWGERFLNSINPDGFCREKGSCPP